MSREEMLEQFSECWEGLDDPRSGNAALHDFHELLLIALCAVLSGGQGAVDMALFAKAKEPFLRGFLKLENGAPSHDTFSRLFRNLDPEQFRASFQRFIAKFSEGCQGVVAIDGKVLRRSFDRASGKSALCMVSAWGCEQRLVLAQIATDAKSNEITAVPKLLEMLALKDTIVTADALHCQRDTAAQIVEQGGEYALALKANQSAMYDDVKLFFDDPECEAVAGPPLVETSRDRIETRTATVWTDIGWIEKSHRWPALAAIGRVVRVREADGKTTSETALLPAQPSALARPAQHGRPKPLADRKPLALEARCGHERGPGQNPARPWPRKSRRAPPHGAQRHAKGRLQGLPAR